MTKAKEKQRVKSRQGKKIKADALRANNTDINASTA